jgi:hypothetical protein
MSWSGLTEQGFAMQRLLVGRNTSMLTLNILTVVVALAFAPFLKAGLAPDLLDP